MVREQVANCIRTRWANLGLHQRLGALLVVLTVLPVVLITFVIWQPYEKTMKQSVVVNNQEIAERIAGDMDWMLAEKLRVLRLAASNGDIRSLDPGRQASVLRRLVSRYPDILLAVTVDLTGRQVARWDGKAADPSLQYLDRQYIYDVVHNGMSAISGPVLTTGTGEPGIAIAEPIKAGETVVGLIVVNVAMDKRLRYIGVANADSRAVFIVNAAGKFLLQPEGQTGGAADAAALPPLRKALMGQSGWEEYGAPDKRQFAGYSYVPTSGWAVIVQQPAEAALVEVAAVRQRVLVLVFGTAALAALVSLWLAAALTRPIAAIAAAANTIAQGDMSRKAASTSCDEFGLLAVAFNHMTDELSKREAQLRESEDKYRSLVEHLHVGIFRSGDLEEIRFRQTNPVMLTLFGCSSATELHELSLRRLCVEPKAWAELQTELKRNGFVRNCELLLRRRLGERLWCSVSITLRQAEDSEILWVDGVVADITERKEAEQVRQLAHDELESQVKQRTEELVRLNEELRRISFLDALTGIANRRYFDEVLEREWQRAVRQKTPLALIMLDVDYFKIYNDTYGHLAGDSCLHFVAEALEMTTKRATDLVARYGGEEFAIILPETDEAGALAVGERIQDYIRRAKDELSASVLQTAITVSMGIAAEIPRLSEQPSELIAVADRALYEAKQAGRNRIVLGDSTLSALKR
ncbi:diguanylate cyclase domain-containing protein [Propionispora hippei]|uniref:PAS domain S-box-containing protein/diguanylate cyclase (GGDEF) domain-containing protein n=1 Tax=Propionispora hippei DSM 15287 TaxID=1123003 RepID=A0A1M6L5K0_9FIRM|nr:diguanylate cyclase [Propionispora hippei]SHJ66394.1 PAS domain S-box-containing protein/diguanylate cyclase (GGDEF) domain-containing protein [Propionispora hippei DSM 15287]